MAARDIPVRNFSGSLIRDSYRLVVDSTNSTAGFSPDADISQATLDSWLADPLTNRILAMGQADYVQLLIGGTDAAAEAFLLSVSCVVPIANSDNEVAGYSEKLLWQAGLELGNNQCGTVIAGLSSNINSTDLLADELGTGIVYQIGEAGTSTSTRNYASDTDNQVMQLVIHTWSAPYIRFTLQNVTTATLWLLARRVHGVGSQATGRV